MQIVTVNASREYEIHIGSGLLSSLGEKICRCTNAKRICIVSDSNVYPLHGAAAEEALGRVGLEVCSFVFPAGEGSKNSSTYLELLSFLAENRLSRADCVAALGGGVVGDLAGFAAATYLRGIRFVQIPTSLLAAVDSSVGGKTAIDLPAGKNLVGAFYQPDLVVCDTGLLNTLPRSIFLEGCAEVIKYGVAFDRAFFDYLASAGPAFDRERVIRRCVELKRDVVVSDEYDFGERMKLNLGHTVGHAVEARSHFAVSHGAAVAIGTAVVCRAAAHQGLLDCADATAIVALLHRFGLPTETAFSARELLPFLLADKKRSAGSIPLIIPTAIGRCAIVPTPVEALEDFLKAGL